MTKKLSNERGFSLVELIVVIVILALLIGVTIQGVFRYVHQARINIDIQNCAQMQSAIEAMAGLKKFDVAGEPYAWMCVSSVSDTRENLFNNSYCTTETSRIERRRL